MSLSPKFKIIFGRILPIFVSYSLLTIPMTWPAASQLGSHIPGVIGDSYVHLWTFTWLKKSLFSLNSLDAFYTHQIYHPVGVSLLNHNLAWVNFAIWLPLQAIFGPEAGYSLAFLLIYPFNGISAYLLSRELGVTETAAFVAGLITAFWPYNLSHFGHPNLILIAWIILTLLYLYRFSKEFGWKNSILLGIFLALIGVTRWQLLIMAAPVIAIYGLWVLFQNRNKNIWKLLRGFIVAGLLSILLMLPFLTPLLLHQTGRDNPAEVIIDEFQYPTDLLAYFTPGGYHPLWGKSIRPITHNFVGNNIYVRTVGYTTLLLLIIGAFKQWPKARIWVAILLLTLFLALGSDLYIAGRPTISLPFRFIEDSFLIKTLRFPDRFNAILVIPISLLAALGVETTRKLPRLRSNSKWVVGIFCVLILFEYANKFQMHSLAIPDWYQQIATDEASYALLDIPAFTREKFNSQNMYFQLYHGKPLVEGNIARTPSETLSFIKGNPLLAHIAQHKNAPDDIVNLSYQMRQLAEANVRHVILHKEHLSPGELRSWQTWFVVPPLHEDESIIVYQTDGAVVGQNATLETVLVGSEANPRLGLITSRLVGEVVQGNWLQLDAVWGNINVAAPSDDLAVCITIHHETSQYFSENCRPVSEAWPISRWQENEIVWARYQFQIDPFAEPGNYQVYLLLRDRQNETVGEAAFLESIELKALPREFEHGAPTELLAAQWEEEISLIGYDLKENEGQLLVDLHWHIAQRIEKSYKFFAHLIDAASGELVAQTDFIPRNWTYPTSWWEAGEYVVDTAVLPLDGVGSGTFRLQIGIYDPDSGERLLVTSSENVSAPTDTVVLTEIDR